MHESVDEPEPVIVNTDKVQVKAVEFVVTARLTACANPFSEEMEIDEVPLAPTIVETMLGAAVTLKSSTWNVTVVEWDNVPLVPVIVTR